MHSLTPPSKSSILSFFAFVSLSRVSSAAGFTQCYYPDGSIPTDYVWEPCTGAEFSSCCIPSEGDICQDNGLCYYPFLGEVFRGTCTDRTWNSPNCPQDSCVAGYEDTWTWLKTCRVGGKDTTLCGEVSGFHSTVNCTVGTPVTSDIRTTTRSSSKPTRYTPPPSLDPSRFSVFTETFSTVITADDQTTTVSTTWQSTVTSTISQPGSGGGDYTGTITSGPSGTSVPSNNGPNNDNAGGKIALSPGVLAAAIAGPIILIALLILAFFLYRKRAAKKKGLAGSTRLNSPAPPPNGPVGRDQVVPYEVPASEAKGSAVAGVSNVTGVGDKHVYTGTTRRAEEGDAYEMGAGAPGEKGWGGHHNAVEAPGDAWNRGGGIPGHTNSIRSPAPVYNEDRNGPVVMPVELYGSEHYGGQAAGR